MTIDERQGDLALFNNRTHGEIFSQLGEPRLEQGLLTAVFISLFSGREGRYWGNQMNNDPNFHYGGEFESLAEALDANVQNALLMEEAILNDLEWMKNAGIAINIEVDSSIELGEIVNFDLRIERPGGQRETFSFSTNWEGQFENPSHVGIES